MTFDQFITKYTGKKVDWDGAYGGQCVDLYRQYCHDVLAMTKQTKPVVGAKDIYLNFDSDTVAKANFTKIANTPTGIPQKGDVIVWDKWTGNTFGHIAIFIDGDVNKFNSLDQNWNNIQLVKKVSHNYTVPKVLGWLRPKNIMALKDTVIDFDDGEGKRKTVEFYVREWWVEKQRAEKLVVENELLVKELDKLRSENAKLREVNAKLSTENTEITGKNIALMNEVTNLNSKIKTSENALQEATESIDRLGQEIERLKLSLDSCKKQNLDHLTLGDFISWVGMKLGIKK